MYLKYIKANHASERGIKTFLEWREERHVWIEFCLTGWCIFPSQLCHKMMLSVFVCTSTHSVQRIHTWPLLIVRIVGLHRQNLLLILIGKGVLFRQLQDILLTGFVCPGCQSACWHLPWLKDNLLIRGSVLFGRFWHGQQVKSVCARPAAHNQQDSPSSLLRWGWANRLSALWQRLGCLRPPGVQILGKSLHSCKCRSPPAAASRAPSSSCAHPWSHRHERWMDPHRLSKVTTSATSISDFAQKILYQTVEFWVCLERCFQKSVQYHLRTQGGG